MGTRTKRIGAVGLWTGLAIASWQDAARSDDRKQACLDASNQGQTFLDQRKLIEARGEFQRCSDAACPSIVRKDCEGWFERAQADVPSLALEPKDSAGSDVINAKVTIDGSVVAPGQLDGRSIELNPGTHVVRFELPDGTAVEAQALLHEGDKNHVVTAVLRRAEAPAGGTLGTAVDTPVAHGLSPLRTAGVVIGGAGLATLLAGGIFGFEAISKQKDADCPNNVCKDESHLSALSSARSAATLSTALVASGGVLTGAGLALWFFAPRTTRPDKGQWRVTPIVGRGFEAATLGGTW